LKAEKFVNKTKFSVKFSLSYFDGDGMDGDIVHPIGSFDVDGVGVNEGGTLWIKIDPEGNVDIMVEHNNADKKALIRLKA